MYFKDTSRLLISILFKFDEIKLFCFLCNEVIKGTISINKKYWWDNYYIIMKMKLNVIKKYQITQTVLWISKLLTFYVISRDENLNIKKINFTEIVKFS